MRLQSVLFFYNNASTIFWRYWTIYVGVFYWSIVLKTCMLDGDDKITIKAQLNFSQWGLYFFFYISPRLQIGKYN